MIFIAGGGSGGHVAPGLAVAEEWKSRFPDESILFIGAQGGLEEKMVPARGFSLSLLKLGTLNRVSFKQKCITLFRLPFALLKSTALLLKHRPRVTLGVGGYASGPTVMMAGLLSWLWGGKVALTNPDRVAGLTNRILRHFVGTVFTSFEGMESQFPGKRVIRTGFPVRSQLNIAALKSRSENPFRLFIFGGSQGAVGLNTLVLESLPFLDFSQGQIKITHQTGVRDYSRVSEGYKKYGLEEHVEVVEFISEMAEEYSRAHLLICRAGMSTLSEIASIRRAALFVPLPTASDNHQEANARVYAEAGAGICVPQNQTSGEQLAEIIKGLMNSREKISAIEAALAPFDRPSAAKELVDHLCNS